MTEAIEYQQFEQDGNGDGPASDRGGRVASAAGEEVDLSRLSDIPMELSVEIGRTHMTVGETLDLRVGSVVALERLSGETADLLVNGTAIARGEVVVIDEQYGLRITEILDAEHGGEHSQASASGEGGEPNEVDEEPAASADPAREPAAHADEAKQPGRNPVVADDQADATRTASAGSPSRTAPGSA